MNTEQPPQSIAAIIAEIRGARNAASDITLVTTDWLTQWADRIEASEACKAKNADLDALERACEIVLDGNTLKAVIEAKRRIKEGAAK